MSQLEVDPLSMSTEQSMAPFEVKRVAGRLPRQWRHGLRVEHLGRQSLSTRSPQELGITYWFDPREVRVSGPVTIQVSGRRQTGGKRVGPGDRFTVDETLDVDPGVGPVAITLRVGGVNPGRWEASAVLLASPGGSRSPRPKVKLPTTTATGTTGYAPVIQARAPGALLGAWPALVGAGALTALVTLAILAGHLHLSIVRVLVVGVVSAVVGLVGAKAYYAIGHYALGDRGTRALLSGACIQGFVLGAGAALAVGTPMAGLPLGAVLDMSAPALLIGMAIGRYGCFFGGCCVGRPTTSRWGLWSSDRRLGLRRVPVQLFESTTALGLGLAALGVVWSGPVGHAEVLVGALAAYTLVRQLLFPLRAVARHTSRGRVLALVASGAVLATDMAIAALVG